MQLLAHLAFSLVLDDVDILVNMLWICLSDLGLGNHHHHMIQEAHLGYLSPFTKDQVPSVACFQNY